MRHRKEVLAHPWLPEAAREGLEYQPMVVSCFGRWEDAASAVLEQLCRKAARRHGLASAAGVRRRARAALWLEMVRRLVSVVRSCLPRADAEGALLGDLG